MSSSNVVFVCEEVECSILNKYYLFQNGRALLKCRIFIPPTIAQIISGNHVSTIVYMNFGVKPACGKFKIDVYCVFFLPKKIDQVMALVLEEVRFSSKNINGDGMCEHAWLAHPSSCSSGPRRQEPCTSLPIGRQF